MPGEAIGWTSADGLDLFGRRYGRSVGKLPVICLHGLTRNSRDFEDVAPWIAGQGREVFALDMRGRGRSAYDPMAERYNPAVYAQDVAAFAAQQGLSKALFVGTSMGGLITLVLAAMVPVLIGGVVLNDVGPEVSAEGLARIRSYVGKPVNPATWAEAADYARSVSGAEDAGRMDFERIARRLFRQAEDGALTLDYDPRIAEPILAAPADAPQPDLWPLYQALASLGPVLVVRGESSDILSRPALARMAELSPQFDSVEVPGVGHAPTLDEPQARTAIAALLERAP
jgi:pimeloyl-ACP methyl ester carboxylesterase